MNRIGSVIGVVLLCLLWFLGDVGSVLALPVWGSSAVSGPSVHGSRNTRDDGGLTAEPVDKAWATEGFSIEWRIVPVIVDSQTLWKYEYFITANPRDSLSGWLLEFTQKDRINFYSEDGVLVDTPANWEGPKLWTGLSNNLPLPAGNTLWGFKLGSETEVKFVTDLAPVYGVAVWKDGDVGGNAWTNALNYADYRTNEQLTPDDFIVRPDGGIPIPEPSTILLFATGLAGLAAHWRRRLKK